MADPQTGTADPQTWSGRPLTVGGVRLRNRFVMTPHLGRLRPDRLLRYVEERAAGGVAMVVLPAGQAVYGHPAYPPEIAGPLADGAGDPDGIGFPAADPRHRAELDRTVRPWLARLARVVRRHGAVPLGQIHHPGAERSWDSFQPALAPSPVPADAHGTMPHALTEAGVDRLVDAYAETAACVAAAGMAGVEVHAGHGYLINRFLSPYYNRRTDRYGGSPDGRLLLLTRVLAAVRERIGPHALLGVRLPAVEEVPGGLDVEDVVRIAAAIAPQVSYLNISLGNHDGVRAGQPATAYTAPWLVPGPPAAPTASAVRARIDRPVLVSGRVTTPAAAEALLRSGAADLVGLARALIADPQFPWRAAAGQTGSITHCVGENECTLVPFSCPVNPRAGRERELDPRPVRRARRVVVVGAGPAGVAAATTAAARGHRVVLLDGAGQAGGTLATLVESATLAGWRPMLAQLRRDLAASTVEFRGGVRAGADDVRALEPDAVVLATGAVPLPAGFPTDRQPDTGLAVLGGAVPTGPGPVVVVGGAEPHLAPLAVADTLAAAGRSVVLLTEHRVVGPAVEPRTWHLLAGKLHRAGVVVRTSTRAVSWQGGTVTVEHLLSGVRHRVPAGAVVVARGRAAADGLAGQFPADLPVYLVGDALAPRRLSHATLEGTRFGVAL